jgi:hypothetical protein
MSFRFGGWLRGRRVRLSGKRPRSSGTVVRLTDKRRRRGLRSLLEALGTRHTTAQGTVARWQAQGVVVNPLATAFQASPVSDQGVSRPSRASADAPVTFAHPGNSDSNGDAARLRGVISLAKVRANYSPPGKGAASHATWFPGFTH